MKITRDAAVDDFMDISDEEFQQTTHPTLLKFGGGQFAVQRIYLTGNEFEEISTDLDQTVSGANPLHNMHSNYCNGVTKYMQTQEYN